MVDASHMGKGSLGANMDIIYPLRSLLRMFKITTPAPLPEQLQQCIAPQLFGEESVDTTAAIRGIPGLFQQLYEVVGLKPVAPQHLEVITLPLHVAS